MVDKTHSDGSRWLSSNCYDMTPTPDRLSLVPKSNEAPAPDKSRPKPIDTVIRNSRQEAEASSHQSAATG